MRKMPADLWRAVLSGKSTFFQQFQVVKDGKVEKFKNSSNFQRRCIAIMKNGKLAVIESTEAITLTQFSKDLVALGAQQAAYTDMGLWDEGWYRQKDKIITIGLDRTLTAKQSSWLYFQSVAKSNK